MAARMLILACAMWGLSFPVIKALSLVQSAALPEADTWLLSAVTMVWRFALAAALTALIAVARTGGLRITRGEIAQGLGLGVFGGLGMLLQVDGLNHTEASTSAFLTQGTVVFIPVFKMLREARFPALREALCCVLALAGIAVLAKVDWARFRLGRGEWETLVAAMFFTGQILWLERPAFQGNNSLRVSVVMFGSIALLCLPLLGLPGGSGARALALLSAGPSWWLVGLLVGPCTLMAFLWMNRWQPHVTATMAGLIYCLEPVFASLLALFLPAWLSSAAGVHYANETVTATLIGGGGLILVANVIMQWPGTPAAGLLNEHGVSSAPEDAS